MFAQNFQTAGLAGLSGTELLVVLGVFPLLAVPILYMRTLERALERCALDSRAMSPGKVWLLLIPLFNVVWNFIVVTKLAKSLGNKFARRNVPRVGSEPGKAWGLAMCILFVCSAIPTIGACLWLAGFICWVVYWVQISAFSRELIAGS